MSLILEVHCAAHGTSYIPVMSEMCDTFDVNKVGLQSLLIGYNGQGVESFIAMHPFTDVGDTWYTKGVVDAYLTNYMTGLTRTKFGSTDTLARAQFAMIVYRMENSPTITYKDIFPDVAKDIWYTNAILWANQSKIVTGYTSTGYLGPSDYINREQMAVMMHRYATYKKYDMSQKIDLGTFRDASLVNSYAKEAMQWAVASGIITGKDNGTRLDPLGNANRAECAIILTRFLAKYSLGS